MRYAFAPLALGLGANALVARHSTQCFKLEASGGASGVLGQLDDGQNRVGGGHSTGCYCLDGNGGFTDSNGRGCILTPPTTQFQCDVGATPTNGFAVGSGGVTYNGSGKFYACPVNDNGEYNVYTTPAPGQDKCVEISLGTAGSCGAGASQPAGTPPAATQSKPAETHPPKTPEAPAPQPPKPSGPAPTGPNQPENTGYPGKPDMPGKPEHPDMPEGQKPSQPAPEAPKPSQPAPQVPEAPKPAPPAPEAPEAPKPAPPAPQVPQESVCIPHVVTVTITQPAAPPAATKPAPPAETKPAGAPEDSCPKDLNGNYEYPHLIVPVDSEQPDKVHDTSYNGKVDGHTCTVFNFDIPASMAGKKCSTMFMLPKKEDLETSDYTMSGHGKCTVSKLKGNADAKTTYHNMPAKAEDVASMELSPGNTYSIESGNCEAGKTVSYMMCGSGDFSMDYFQDWNPSPIGMYVRQC